MRFNWLGYEVSNLLPENWRQQVIDVANKHTVYRDLPKTPLTSREDSSVISLSRGRVSGEVVYGELPWLFEAYHSFFLSLASRFTSQMVYCAKDIRYGVVLNVAKGNHMRFECHVDSNPLEGLLFCTDHPPGAGGELIVSNNKEAVGISKVNEDCSTIYPISGQLVFFDAREYPHYVKPLQDKDSMRVVAAMNYYTDSCQENTRPQEINRYLFGRE